KKVYAFAAIVLGVVIGTFIFTKKEEKATTVNTTISNKPIIQPGGKKAILVIENGTNILLDETKNGLLKTNSIANIQQNNHQLNYTANSHLTEQQFHTITTPNGGEYELVLADGTKVWLNAASSLRFPTNFTSNTRTVTLSGEAYFEVTPNKNKPFIVETGKSTIHVLGTNFNVMNYPNESAIKTTLLEGSVSVHHSNQTAKLLPGNQAIINKEKIETLPVDVEEVVAWKNGLFTFHKSDLKTIMKQLARWYDVEVSYVGIIPEKRFVGDINRNSNLSEVLKILATSGIKFTVEGKKIIVTH
ncbi:MAG: FecR family protein, partial [Chitinophagaceae bacterium]